MICLRDFFLQFLHIFLKDIVTDEQVALKKKEKTEKME